MSQDQAQKVLERARDAARSQKPFVIKSYKLPPQTEAQIEEALGVFLSELDRDVLKDSLAYCLRELSVNGKKANTKRVYFEEKGLLHQREPVLVKHKKKRVGGTAYPAKMRFGDGYRLLPLLTPKKDGTPKLHKASQEEVCMNQDKVCKQQAGEGQH